jgi:NADP-dependent 3-hydroxy acid dehydrogenase YdfG
VLIAGADGGLGAEVAKACRDAGWALAQVDIAKAQTTPAVQGQLYISGVDMRDPKQAEAACGSTPSCP